MAEVTVTTYKPEVLILSGLPGSGKTHEAQKWVDYNSAKRTRINWDDLRLEMFGAEWRFNRKDEQAMKDRSIQMFHDAMRLGLSVVIDNTNLTKASRAMWAELASPYGVTVREREIDTDIWTCIEQDNARKGRARVGRAVIERMALCHGFIDWKGKDYEHYEGFVVCDMDGTLADIAHRRHFVQTPDKPKDWKGFFANVSSDKLNAPVAEMLDMFARDGYGILIVSGRPIDQCGIATQDWLADHGIKYDHLFMRASGDSRDDTIIKKEIADHLPLDMIDYVLDDRDRVVKMWRDLDLFTLQVAEGNF